MRFKTDENIHPAVAAFLQRCGHDTLTVWDQGMRGASDTRVLDTCCREARVLITMDLDFADVRLMRSDSSTGTIVLRLNRQDRTSALEAIKRVVPLVESQPLLQHLWVVDERRVRIRGALSPPIQ